MDKRIERMMQLLSDAYTMIQNVTIQATESNTSAYSASLRRIKAVFNILDEMRKEQKGEDQGGSVPEDE